MTRAGPPRRGARSRPLALALATTLALGGCRGLDHKYWNFYFVVTIHEAAWRAAWPDTNALLRCLAFLLLDLPLLPVTLCHDVYALFALEDEGLGDAPGPAPAPTPTPEPAPAPEPTPAPTPAPVVEAPPGAPATRKRRDPVWEWASIIYGARVETADLRRGRLLPPLDGGSFQGLVRGDRWTGSIEDPDAGAFEFEVERRADDLFEGRIRRGAEGEWVPLEVFRRPE